MDFDHISWGALAMEFRPLNFNIDREFVSERQLNPFIHDPLRGFNMLTTHHEDPEKPYQYVMDIDVTLDQLHDEKMLYPVREITLAEYHFGSDPEELPNESNCFDYGLRDSSYRHPFQLPPEPEEVSEDDFDEEIEWDDSYYDEFDGRGKTNEKKKPAAIRKQPVLIKCRPHKTEYPRDKYVDEYNHVVNGDVSSGSTFKCGCINRPKLMKFETIEFDDGSILCGKRCLCGETFLVSKYNYA